MIRIQQWFILLLLSTALIGCGGGGGDDSGQSGSTSSVNAGREQTVNETDSFTLTALGDPAGGKLCLASVIRNCSHRDACQHSRSDFNRTSGKSR